MAGEREVVAYYAREILSKKIEELKKDDAFDTQEFHFFMSENFPTYKITKVRAEKMRDYLLKIMERALRPIETTLASYKED